MAVFRVPKIENFTMMSNHHLRNKKLSLKAVGLMSKILSLPDEWDYSLKGLAKLNADGIDGVRSAVQELEDAGYIIRRQRRDKNGRMAQSEYLVFEMHYNPFAYIRSEKDILKLVNTIIVNTKGDGDKSGEDFWVKAEKLYYTALIGYIWYEAPDHEKNFTTLLEMINASEAREDDETFKNPVDVMFDELEARDPDHFAVKQYRKYKLAAGDICSK